jgi:Putative Flp pilus-assembly TadE/G-like
MRRTRSGRTAGRERGATLVLVAVSLVVLLSAAALAIDLGILYVARSEAQRAADAAALAGAYTFVTSGCTSHGGCVSGGPQETLARQQAELIGAQNGIIGQGAQIQDGDISFTYPTPEEPQITVSVERTAARGNAVPTIFARIFGVTSSGVSATATAEAYNPSGAASGSPSVGTNCVAPFLVPNCDPNHYNSPAGNDNTACASSSGYFINPTTGAIENGSSPGSVVGQTWQLHYGSTGPSDGAAPSQWYMVAYNGSQSGSNLRQYISQCSPVTINCGDTLQTYNGKSNGPVDQGVEDRIHATGLGMNQGQDTIDTSVGPPFPITGGLNNPDSSLVGQTYFGPSDSVVTVPVYDGSALSAGGSTVTVIGFMQLFLQDANHSGTSDYVNAVIMNVSGCPNSSVTSNGSGTSSTVTSTGGSPIAVRLIHQ